MFTKREKKSGVEVLSTDIELRNENDIIFGNPKAELSVIVFGNYSCKFCSKFFKEVLPVLLKEYKDGIKFVLKPVPFSDTKEEMDALQMAVSVFKYGNYESFHELLLKDSNVIYDKNYQEYILEIMNLNQAIADNFLDDETRLYIERNRSLFKDLKLKGTPTFIVDHKILSGYLDIKKFEEIINNSLKD
ncbi:thioredoxin domain-containing protein [Plebeiibacterium sediminum]|uniref:Thioredoxin domain-containing protein n=1 Tax=Plebeiibacterium sediminum TaxID=2992112 RepID=A0AAE3M5B8_9BACT|nr:thioredoxin domain-containing protein [Plebeiobacterium sediminum]MCW3787541.1 thioredoxin domain-containing protein [Plebeiobacterium sediminum]